LEFNSFSADPRLTIRALLHYYGAVWSKVASIQLTVTLHITLPRDDEECRLFGIYEASSAKEHAVASKLLSPHLRLPLPAYMTLLGDLRVIRAQCNEDMLAIAVHHKKMLGLSTLH
jgi:hypothetical protein